jgi:hypothetical protein
MSKVDTRIHFYGQGEKTDQLICNWCGEPHAVESEYKEQILERGATELEELRRLARQGNISDDEIKALTPDQTWTCGKCMLFLNNLPIDAMMTDCHDHEVPKQRNSIFC